MPSGKEYLQYAFENLNTIDGISYRPMMGEYVLYYKTKVIGGIYDNRLLVKPTKSAIEFLPDAQQEIPYAGAKPMLLIEDLENHEFLVKLFELMLPDLPAPKNKKKK